MKGICFIEPLFQAIIAGEKTQTRRIVPANGIQRYKEGDILYLKEPYYSTLDVNGLIQVIHKYNGFIPPDFQIPPDFHWQNKLFMPEYVARYFITITSVRKERLQEISNEDCIKEAAVQWLIDYVQNNAPKFEDGYWIDDEFHHYDQGVSFCEECGEKEVKKLKEKAKKEGASKDQINDILLKNDNSWDCGNDDVPSCETCYKPLGTYLHCNIEEYIEDEDFELNELTLYALNQFVDDDREKIVAIKKLHQKAYAFLIDKINGEGTWDSNPYVFVYDFQLFNDKEN
jgi:hypothetical protein